MRIELDDVQTLALRASRILAERARGDAIELDKQVDGLLVDAQRLKTRAKEIRQQAADSMRNCWATIASCHGTEIPDHAQADLSGDRVVITWEPEGDVGLVELDAAPEVSAC